MPTKLKLGLLVLLLGILPALGQNTFGPFGKGGSGGGGGTTTNLNVGRTIYVDQVNGVNSSGARGNAAKPFLSIAWAKTNAQAGDTIVVGPGTYYECDLLKKGVNYYFQPGSLVSFVAVTNNSFAIFDERSTGATTNSIGGYGNFTYTNVGSVTPLGVLVVTQALSNISFKGAHITVDYQVAGTPFAAFDIRNCQRVFIDVNEITDPEYGNNTSSANGIYWQKGEVYAHVGFAQMDNGYVAWADSPAPGVVNNLWYDGDYCESFGHSAFYLSTTLADLAPDYKLWIRAKEIKTQNTSAVVGIRGGKIYVDAEKLTGVNGATVVSVSDSSIWLNAQKVECDFGTLIQLSGAGRNFINVLQYSYTGLPTVPAIDITGGTNEFFGGRLILTNQTAVSVRGSTVTRLAGMHITGVATTPGGNTNNPIVVNTNGLTLANMKVFAPTGANALWNTNPASVTVTIDGILNANTSIAQTNITMAGNTNWMAGDLNLSAGRYIGDGSLLTNLPQVVTVFGATNPQTNLLFNAALGKKFRVRLTNSMACYVTNGTDGDEISCEFYQDATGNRTVVMKDNTGGANTNRIAWSITDVTASNFILSTNAVTCDRLKLAYSAGTAGTENTTNRWDPIGFFRGNQ